METTPIEFVCLFRKFLRSEALLAKKMKGGSFLKNHLLDADFKVEELERVLSRYPEVAHMKISV